MPTMNTTYLIQTRESDGSWGFHSPREYPSEAQAREAADTLLHGVPYRLVKVTREVLADEPTSRQVGIEMDDGSITYYEL